MKQYKDAKVLLYKDTYAELKKKEIEHEGKITVRDLADRYIRLGLGLPLIDRFAQDMLKKALSKALTNESKKYINKLYLHLGTLEQAAEISRRKMRHIPQEWKELPLWEEA